MFRPGSAAMSETIYAFDLDGTVTAQEILPCIAANLNLQTELELLTRLTLEGIIDFEASFRLRFHILRNIPPDEVREIVSRIPLEPSIEKFIAEHREACVLVTGNLDCWVAPLLDRLGCRAFTSVSRRAGDRLELESVLSKGAAIRALGKEKKKIVAVGESVNDIPMFEEADIGIAFGGVHEPALALARIADYIAYDGKTLCGLLCAL
jgi:HAD superfamily phosphoserine phosphatase-like hydrolase